LSRAKKTGKRTPGIKHNWKTTDVCQKLDPLSRRRHLSHLTHRENLEIHSFHYLHNLLRSHVNILHDPQSRKNSFRNHSRSRPLVSRWRPTPQARENARRDDAQSDDVKSTLDRLTSQQANLAQETSQLRRAENWKAVEIGVDERLRKCGTIL